MQEAGYKVGLYTSPHLIDYNERIRINGEIASDAQIIEQFDSIEQARGDITLEQLTDHMAGGAELATLKHELSQVRGVELDASPEDLDDTFPEGTT